MKKILYILIVLLQSILAISQQWIDKKYDYDSTFNIKYGSALDFQGLSKDLYLDLYLPNCDDSLHVAKRPLILFIHGGAFIAGNKNDPSIQDLCKQFAKRGYVTASVGYRLGFVSDDASWTCNFPNYSCAFAADSSEWVRAGFRGIQDVKGALRYLVNRNQQYKIDVNNIFVAGESAGAFAALGVALLDTAIEMTGHTAQLSAVPIPNSNTMACEHNVGRTFSGTTIARPDLGSIDGDIEPTTIDYTIKGVGNFYGGIFGDWLKYNKANKPKPAIYSFHQKSDMVVPIDSNYVYWGLSWCMTNGYGCYGIANNKVMIYGSRTFSNLNTQNNYGYNIQNEFVNVEFPYSYLFGQGSCVDQVNNPTHAYDNKTLRENNLASFFAPLVNTYPICDTMIWPTTSIRDLNMYDFEIYPNPASSTLTINPIKNINQAVILELKTIDGRVVLSQNYNLNNGTQINVSSLTKTIYILNIVSKDKVLYRQKLVVQ